MTERALVSRKAMEAATALATAAVGAAVIWGAVEHDIGWDDSGPGAGYFPFRIGLLIVLASLANLTLALWRGRTEPSAFLTREQFVRVLSFGLPIVAFVAVSIFLGLYVATVLYLFGVMVFQGGYRPLVALAFGVAVAVVMRLVFPMWFKVPLLTGPLEAWLRLY
jgi:hypothetical protein